MNNKKPNNFVGVIFTPQFIEIADHLQVTNLCERQYESTIILSILILPDKIIFDVSNHLKSFEYPIKEDDEFFFYLDMMNSTNKCIISLV